MEGARCLPNITMFQKCVLSPGCTGVVGIVGLGRGRGRHIARVATLEMFFEKFIPISSKEEGHPLPDGFAGGLRFWKRSQNESIIEV
jgi:hypothetical protein